MSDSDMPLPLPDATAPLPEGAAPYSHSRSRSQSRPNAKSRPPTSFKRTHSSPTKLPTIPDNKNPNHDMTMTSFMRFSTTQSELEAMAGTDRTSMFGSEADQSQPTSASNWYYHAPGSGWDRSSRISRESRDGRQSFDTFGPKERGGDRFFVGGGGGGGVDEHGSKAGTDGGGGEEGPISTMSSTSDSVYNNALTELDRFRLPAGVTESKGKKAGEDKVGDRKDVLPGKVFRFDRSSRPIQPSQASSRLEMSEPKVSSSPSPPEGILRNSSNASSTPPSRHRPAASVPHFEPLHHSPHLQIQQSPMQFTPSPRPRTRSRSIDSISLHPSLSDSVTGLLVPPISGTTFPRPVLPHRSTSSILPAELMAKNDLDPEQRAILLRRARKLEQLLGQPIGERSIERLLIDPITAPRTITTHATDQAWPESPSSKSTSTSTSRSKADAKDKGKAARRKSLAEWQKDDVVPRLERTVPVEAAHTVGGNGLARSGSVLARKARNALGMGVGSAGAAERKKGKTDLAVYVSREVRIQETSEGRIQPPRQTASTPPGTAMPHHYSSNGSPASPTHTVTESRDSDDEITRRTRRLQLAKLHRLLGVPIPPDLVGRRSQDQDTDSHESTSPENGQANDHSFIVFDESLITPSSNWTSALRHTLNKVRSKDKDKEGRRSDSPVPAPTPPVMSREASCADMGTMNEKEKAVARKKAQKLEYMFGDAPPQSMFLPRPATPAGEPSYSASISTANTATGTRSSQESGRTRQFSQGSYKAYETSLSGLLYLADNDTDTLDVLMDQLELEEGSSIETTTLPAPATGITTTTITGPSPSSGPLPLTHEARRRRTGKLTHFFGETGIDFDDPPNIADTMERVRSRSNTTSGAHGHAHAIGGKGDTLDEMMREMWRGVQAEVRRGGMAVKEGERLGEMIDRLRRRRGAGAEGRWEAL